MNTFYNRKQVGDIQYTHFVTHPNSVTESEKDLTEMYKRVVMGGKCSETVIILFPTNMQQLINFMTELRNNDDFVPLINLQGTPNCVNFAL